MSDKKKYIDLQYLASKIKETAAELKQLDDSQIEDLKKMLDDETQQTNRVSDEFAEYVPVLEKEHASQDSLNAKISLEPTQKSILFEELKKQELTLDQLLNDYVQNFIVQNTPPKGGVLTMDDPIWNIVGASNFDITDGSVNHDHYIYGTPKIED